METEEIYINGSFHTQVVDEVQKKQGKGKKYINKCTQFSEASLTNQLQRVDYTTKLINPDKRVQCALCMERMSLLDYQRDHLSEHNFLCWLTEEEPLDIENEAVVERILARVKLRFPKFMFKCQRCLAQKKSAKGFLSHRQFCGKSKEEKMNLMVPCKICGKLLMPSSLDSHVYLTHVKERREETVPVHSLETMFIRSSEEMFLDTRLMGMDNLISEKVNLKKVEPLSDIKCDTDDDLFRCLECSFCSKLESEVMAHIRAQHPLNVIASEPCQKNDGFKNVSGLPYIPFLKNAENLFSRPKVQAKFFIPALEWTKQQRFLYFAHENLFSQYEVEFDQWVCKPEDDFKEYVQAIDPSMRITCNSIDWFHLKLFESHFLNDNLAMLFCGGPVFGLGWAPGRGKQFLAVAAHLSVHNFYQMSSTCTGPGNIQIWSFGNMNNFKDSSFYGTKLEYIICHDEGGCWGLEWCPSGCRNDHRMGLLALVTSSGSIPIYSVPLPCKSEDSEIDDLPLYKPQPILRLELGGNLKYQCSRISWSKVRPHSIIAAGFVNGFIGVWDITSESPLLRKGKILLPFKVFQAHHSVVSGLSFSPVCDNYLVSSGCDKTIKFWDLKDTTAPHSNHRRSLATDLCWLTHWMTCIAAIDSVYSAGETTLTLNSIRDFVYEPQAFLTGVDSAALSVSSNDWLNWVATAYDNGQVNLSFGRKHAAASDDRKKYVKVLLEPNLFDFRLNSYVPKQKKGSTPSTANYVRDCNSYDEAVGRYGIDFKFDLELGFKEKLTGNVANPIEIYPLLAANKVCWNTNIDCFLTLAVGYQSGIVVIPKVCLVPQDQAKIEKIDHF